MVGKHPVRLGSIQQTLFIPLLARARETAKKRPVLTDPKAVEMAGSIDHDPKYDTGRGGGLIVLRTAIYDVWVRAFLAEHPAGTVVELGTGLNTRFERVDNGAVHWIDLDLPDTIELRREFFEDSGRRRMIAASLLDDSWHETVLESPGPYFFVTEGVLVYLPGDEVTGALGRIAARFPGAMIALDTYTRKMVDGQHRRADRRGGHARWMWACEDPRSLERFGLRVVEAAAVTRPPRSLRGELTAGYRIALPIANRLIGGIFDVTLFEAAGHQPLG